MNSEDGAQDRRDPNNGQLVEYRLGKLEELMNATRRDMHEFREMLQPVMLSVLRINNLETDVKVLQEASEARYRELTAKCAANDGEFQKWFNRGVGVVGICGALVGLFGKMLTDQIAELRAGVSQIQGLTERVTRQEIVGRKIVRKLGVDPDMLPDEQR